MPFVYILTNESMPDIVKIGFSETSLVRRIREMDKTEIPLPFECYYAVEVPDARALEKKIHQGLDDCRVRRGREFFYITPERAKSLLEVAELMGGKNVTPTTAIVDSPGDQEALNRAKDSKKRFKFNFGMLGLDEGTTLEFKKDKTITCTVASETQVSLRDEIMSLSRAADIVLREMGYDWKGVQGTIWWCRNGETLHDLRLEAEQS